MSGRYSKSLYFERHAHQTKLEHFERRAQPNDTFRSIIDIDVGNQRFKRFHLVLYDHETPSVHSNDLENGLCVGKAHAIMIVFDVSDISSYEWIESSGIIEQIRATKHNSAKLPLILVGNKVDAIDANFDFSQKKGSKTLAKLSDTVKRIVPIERIQKEYENVPYIEVSAVCCVNVEQLFEIAVKEALSFSAQGTEWKYIM